MQDKPIYIDLGNGNFRRWRGTRRDLKIVSGHNIFGGLPQGGRSVEEEGLLKSHAQSEADMISIEEPDEEKWESLRKFITSQRA